MIPQRLLSGVCEITTGQLSITQRPPVYTGEASALTVQISFKFQGVDYDIPETVVAEMYLRYPNTEVMTVATEMAVDDNVATGVLTAEQTGVAGYPLLVIQLTDSDTASVIVACATTVKVSDVRGNLVVDTRPPSPSEIIYVGRSPYIDPTTKNWMVWNVDQGQYVDSGILAEGTQGYTPEISIGVIQSVPTGESAAVRLRGTARYPIMDMDLPRSGDGIGEHEIYQTIAVAEWGGTGPYTYDIADPTINASMVIVEKWFDDGTVVPADLYATVPSAGHVLLSIAVKPEQSIGLHLSLCTNGTDILEDLSDAIEAVNQAVEDVQDAVEVVEGIGPYDGLDSTSTALALSANQGKRLSDQIVNLQSEITPYVETTTTASRAYSIGEYFTLNAVLRKATSVISAGNTITDNNSKIITNGGLNDLSYSIIPYEGNIPANSEITLNYESLFYEGMGVYLLTCGNALSVFANAPLAIISYGQGGRIQLYSSFEGGDYWSGKINFTSSGEFDLKLKNTSQIRAYEFGSIYARKLM